MKNEHTLITIKEYGQITLHLKELMDAKGITRNALARAINTRFEVIDKWYSGQLDKLDLDILARICHILKCDVSDILSYEDTENQTISFSNSKIP